MLHISPSAKPLGSLFKIIPMLLHPPSTAVTIGQSSITSCLVFQSPPNCSPCFYPFSVMKQTANLLRWISTSLRVKVQVLSKALETWHDPCPPPSLWPHLLPPNLPVSPNSSHAASPFPYSPSLCPIVEGGIMAPNLATSLLPEPMNGTFCGRKDFADTIELKDYPGLPWWAHISHRELRRGTRKELDQKEAR